MKNILLMLITVTFVAMHSVSTIVSAQEKSFLSAAVKAEAVRLDSTYKSIDGIGIKPDNGPIFYQGTRDEAVILVHGFSASPFEVRELGKFLNAHGFSVYLPLVEGFGSSTTVANHSTIETWRNSVAQAYEAMALCFNKIHLLGFSNGGALVTDFVLRHPDKKVKSLVALSPYYKVAIPAIDNLNWFKTDSVTDVSFKTLYSLTRSADLVPVIENPQYYNEDLPVKAAKTILELGNEIRKIPVDGNNKSLPVFLSFSVADETIDGDFALEFLNKHFSSIEVLRFPKSAKVPHQITLAAQGYSPTELFERIAKFLKR